MKNAKPIILLKILIGLYWFNYMAMFFRFDLASINWDAEQITVYAMMLLFTITFVIAFFRLILAGILLQLWNVLVWVFALSIWPDAGMVLILAAPALVLGVFTFYFGLKEEQIIPTDPATRWKVILQSLFVNYAIISVLGIVFGPNREHSIWEMPFLIAPLFTFTLLVLFAVSWKHKFITGILLVLWYGLAGVFRALFPEVPNQEGPILLFGFPLFIQGFLYIIYHLKFQGKNETNETA